MSDDYDKNLLWARNFIRKFDSEREKDPNKWQHLKHIQIRLSGYEKTSQFFVMFSYQAPNSYCVGNYAEPVLTKCNHQKFVQAMKVCFMTYRNLAKDMDRFGLENKKATEYINANAKISHRNRFS